MDAGSEKREVSGITMIRTLHRWSCLKRHDNKRCCHRQYTGMLWRVNLDPVRLKFMHLLQSIPSFSVKYLKWSEEEGCIDIVYRDGRCKSVRVKGLHERDFMQCILKAI